LWLYRLFISSVAILGNRLSFPTRRSSDLTGSDSAGMSMGVFDTQALPVYHYLHGSGHPKYAILDNFFHAAFGGSFLNHQWLIARSEEHTSELQSRGHLVCRLLLEKKNIDN